MISHLAYLQMTKWMKDYFELDLDLHPLMGMTYFQLNIIQPSVIQNGILSLIQKLEITYLQANIIQPFDTNNP